MKEALISSIGETAPICPYCRTPLDKMPGYQKKCPHCKNTIIARIRPHDQKKILLKESEFPAYVMLSYISSIIDQIEQRGEMKTYLKVEKDLHKKWNQPPSLQDVIWHTGMQQAMALASDLDWGLFRNQKFFTANSLKKLGDRKRALILYLEICYTDLNGPQNRGGMPRSMLKEHPMFDLKWAFLAPAAVDNIKEIMIDQNISIDNIRSSFLALAEQYHKHSKFPVDPKKAWASLEKELKAKND